MNYEDEARNMLTELFREWWMNDEDWSNFLVYCEKFAPFSEMGRSIQTGVENGYSVEQQKTLMLALFKDKD